MGSKLIITKWNGRIISALIEQNELLQISAYRETSESSLGNVYLGKVKNIVKNINAAFVEIEPGNVCFLPLTNHIHPVFANRSSETKIQIGDELLVQIQKEDGKRKSPFATTELTLTGKYSVLIHGSSGIGISSKITDINIRTRLRRISKPMLEDGIGLILRTNAMQADDEIIQNEMMRLKQDYKKLIEYGVQRNCYSLLYHPIPSYLWEIRDVFSPSVEVIKTDDLELYEQIKQYLEEYQTEDLEKLSYYQDNMLSLANLYSIPSKIENALKEQVWLNSGAYLVIQPTEALTVIDVNTGKAVTKNKEMEETFFRVNCEAAAEIAHQLRVRNLSGIIVIDFINMEFVKHQRELLKQLDEYLKVDPVKTVLVDMTALHLVELTRHKVRKPLHEQMEY